MYLLDYTCPDCNNSRKSDAGQRCPSCGGIMLARYDYAAIRNVFSKGDLTTRTRSIWRYRELLPLADESDIITRGEGVSPLVSLRKTSEMLGLPGLTMKDDSQQPCGSFKARVAALGVSRALEKGHKALVMRGDPVQLETWASYAARAGLGAVLLAQKNEVPTSSIERINAAGASLYLCEGHVAELEDLAERTAREHGWMLSSPFRDACYLEATKTIGYEIAEDFQWNMPDVIICPAGRVGPFTGMYRAMRDLQAIGWLNSGLPRMVAVQPGVHSPLVKAWQERATASARSGKVRRESREHRVFYRRMNFMMLDAIYKTIGMAVSVEEDEVAESAALFGTLEGINAGEDAAMTLAAAIKLKRSGWLKPGERVTLYNPENPAAGPRGAATGKAEKLKINKNSSIPAEAGIRKNHPTPYGF